MVKGLSHEIDCKNFDKKMYRTELGLGKGQIVYFLVISSLSYTAYSTQPKDLTLVCL